MMLDNSISNGSDQQIFPADQPYIQKHIATILEKHKRVQSSTSQRFINQNTA